MEENRASARNEEMKAILPTFQTHCRLEDAAGDNGKFPCRSSVDVYGAVFNTYECLQGCHYHSVPLYTPCGNMEVSGTI